MYDVHCAALSDFSVRGAKRRHFSCSIYTVLIVQAYQTSQYVERAAAFFSASGAALSQEIPSVK
jgi:hypothetical protein